MQLLEGQEEETVKCSEDADNARKAPIHPSNCHLR